MTPNDKKHYTKRVVTGDEVVSLRNNIGESYMDSIVPALALMSIPLFFIFYFIFGDILGVSFRTLAWSFAGIFVLVLTYSLFHDAKREENLRDWESRVVKSYVNALPVESKDLVQIKIFMSSSDEPYVNSIYTRNQRVKCRWMELSFIDKGLVTLEGCYEVMVSLPKGEKPYLSYQYVDKYLGQGYNVEAFNSGYYNPTLYLPEDYDFQNQPSS